MDTGLIHIYCGDGKGKTTASLGLVLRCAGHGGNVLFAQFLKGRPTGELTALKALPQVTVLRGKALAKFTFQMTPAEKEATRLAQTAFLEEIAAFCQKHQPDLAVCDELVGAAALGLVPEEAVIRFLKEKPAKTEVVLTGRNPSRALIALADYVSEIKKVKHPFDRGIAARIGIEE
ncbi:cob(I)yrinic acid a,c-diamide adenosyltransferase [uncultured Megasphaera sp.]|uniref:cob(I)yrinic acid a,c-diamide adenosyltransferase n=1 Tax=Megasphaera sp. TaxID=2023260 RepID=UPI0025EAE0B5|nr:cob(I)yrinic acid a,c-diamide adenosyltransferase [uncultured Megasphaera sp.]